MRKVHPRKHHSESRSSLIASVATLVLVVLVVVAAAIGRQQASASRDEAKPAHHMASLGEVNSFLHKAQGEQER